MIKLLICLFLLILSLSGCKEKQTHIDPRNHYIEIKSYDEVIEFMKSTRNVNLDYNLALDSSLPDYQFEGVIKKEYIIDGLCYCFDHKNNDHTTLCSDFEAKKYMIYCYTEEDNCFIIQINKSLIKNEITGEEFYGVTNLEDSAPKSAGVIWTEIDGEERTLINIYWYAETDKDWDTPEIYDVPSVYTEEEAKYWHDIVYSTLIEYHNIDGVN